jgi:tetratricopeptide (TPR) repeat protein
MLISKAGFFTGGGTFADLSFQQKLERFDDAFARALRDNISPDPTFIAALFKALENSADGIEPRLSLLKRYRRLSQQFPTFETDYNNACKRAAESFPYSSALSAIAACASLPPSGNAIDTTAKQRIASYLPAIENTEPLGESVYFPFAFMLRALAGDFPNIDAALKVERARTLFIDTATFLNNNATSPDAALESYNHEVAEGISIDAAILSVLSGHIEEALALQRACDPSAMKTRAGTGFFAEFNYDFGDLGLAADLWYKLGDSVSLAHAADAYYLERDPAKARAAWQAVAASKDIIAAPDEDAVRIFYNLAATAPTDEERLPPIRKLIDRAPNFESGIALYGYILYTRLLDNAAALTALKRLPSVQQNPLLDIEVTRRALRSIPVARATPEVWLLVNRHPNTEYVYRWAGWYFNFESDWNDAEFVVETALKRSFVGEWLTYNSGMFAIRRYDYAAARRIFQGALDADVPEGALLAGGRPQRWVIQANMGLVLEAEHNYNAAFSQFSHSQLHLEASVPMVGCASEWRRVSRQKEAQLCLHRAHCLAALGNHSEARNAALEAGALDAENVDVRIAVSKFESLTPP